MKNLILLAMLSLTLAACNTFEGMGKDIQAAGTAVNKAAK